VPARKLLERIFHATERFTEARTIGENQWDVPSEYISKRREHLKTCRIRDLFIGKRHLTSCLENLHLQNGGGNVM